MGWLAKVKEVTQKFKIVLSPYFSSKKRKERIAIISAWAAAHLLELGINTYFVTQAESDDVEQNPWQSVTTGLGNILFSGAMYAFKVAMSNYMVHSITESILEENALEGWLNKEASIGIDFMQTLEQGQAYALSPDTPVERILTEHIKSFSKGTVKLSVENISRIISSAVSLYVIGRLTNINTAAFYFAVGGGLVAACCKMDQAKIDLALKISAHDDTINARLTHIRERAAQILALQGEKHEVELINAIMNEKRKLAMRIFRYEARNNSIMYVTFFGLTPLLSSIGTYAPSVLKAPPASAVAALLFQQHVFQLMINFFIAMENYTQEYPKFGASVDKVHSLKMLLTLWRQVQARRELSQDFLSNSPNLILENFSVNMPTRSEAAGFLELLKNTSITLTPGQYQLLGASNAGKSTTFKAIMGLWPHVSGTIVYPCSKRQMRFIPQETFIPYDATLLEMMIYPEKNADSFARDKIIYLMHKLNLTHLIDGLDKKRDLKMLSRGEQQRLAIIGAIIANPKVLLMDEATASIDANNKEQVARLIKKYLPNALIVIIDHSPLDNSLVSNRKSAQEFPASVCLPALASSSDENPFLAIDMEMKEPQIKQRAVAYHPSYATHFKAPTRAIQISSEKKLEYLESKQPAAVRRKSI